MLKSSQKNQKYPKSWKKISNLLKEEKNFRCEQCGAVNDPTSGHTLTVHHLDFTPSNCDPLNLVVLCQRCHLSVQSWYHPAQLWLFDVKPEWAKKRGL